MGGHKASRGDKCYEDGQRIGMEFAPMIVACDEQLLDDILANMSYYKAHWEAQNAKFLMGYNEPDQKDKDATKAAGSTVIKCDPSKGARLWLKVQKIADEFDPPLRLVSPAPVSADRGDGSLCGFKNGQSPWLDAFFDECASLTECDPERIEIIAFHDYGGDFNITDDNLPNRVHKGANNYKFTDGTKRKLWLTEISVGNGKSSVSFLDINKEGCYYRCPDGVEGLTGWASATDESTWLSLKDQEKFMKQALPFLEEDEDIFRYAWYGVRHIPESFGGFANLLKYDGPEEELSDLGKEWKNFVSS